VNSVKQFLIAYWPWFVVGAVIVAEDVIARSSLKSNSTIQLVSSWLRMIPVLGRIFAVLAPKDAAKVALLAGALGFGAALSACALSPAGRAHVALSTAARLKLAVWRDKRAKARAAEQEYYAALVGWQVALQVAENARDKKFDFASLLDGVTKMGRALLDGLRGLGINVPEVQ